MDPYFQDRHLIKIANDISMPAKTIVKEVNDYKIENELTKPLVFVKQIDNMVQHKIKRIFTHVNKTRTR